MLIFALVMIVVFAGFGLYDVLAERKQTELRKVMEIERRNYEARIAS
jgi:hypothetical protein